MVVGERIRSSYRTKENYRSKKQLSPITNDGTHDYKCYDVEPSMKKIEFDRLVFKEHTGQFGGSYPEYGNTKADDSAKRGIGVRAQNH